MLTTTRVSIFAALVMSGACAFADQTFTFAPGQYDNTANQVTGTNASPVYTNNQTTGSFRDVFWWGPIYNGGTVGVGSPDYINSGQNLVSNGQRSVVGGQYSALNITGQKTGGTPLGASFMTVFDETPGDGAATRSLFSAASGLHLSVDMLFGFDGHSVSGGIVAAYSEGQDSIALLAHNGGGNNPDEASATLVWQSRGVGLDLASVALNGSSFVGDTVGGLSGGNANLGDHWYRLELDLLTSGNSFLVEGHIYNHVDPNDPNSALGSLIANPSHSGLLSTPGNAFVLSEPGEVGLVGIAHENFNDGLGNGGTGANPLTDNVGISFTNFTVPNSVPEPGTVAVLAMGALAALRKRRK